MEGGKSGRRDGGRSERRGGGVESGKEGEVEKRDKGKITSVVHTHLQCKHRYIQTTTL